MAANTNILPSQQILRHALRHKDSVFSSPNSSKTPVTPVTPVASVLCCRGHRWRWWAAAGALGVVLVAPLALQAQVLRMAQWLGVGAVEAQKVLVAWEQGAEKWRKYHENIPE